MRVFHPRTIPCHILCRMCGKPQASLALTAGFTPKLEIAGVVDLDSQEHRPEEWSYLFRVRSEEA